MCFFLKMVKITTKLKLYQLYLIFDMWDFRMYDPYEWRTLALGELIRIK